jgi:hypothetical protein
MDDDAIADITADLRFDRAILLFWFSLRKKDDINIIKYLKRLQWGLFFCSKLYFGYLFSRLDKIIYY